MKKTQIVVKAATKNLNKLKAFKEAFGLFHEDCEIVIVPCEASSGVPAQPINEDVSRGAENRLEELKHDKKEYDYLISCEGGMFNYFGPWFNGQLIVVENRKGRRGWGLSQSNQFSRENAERAIATSVAKVYDDVFDGKGGVREITKGCFTRSDLVRDATIMALSKIMSGEKW